jgi:hypothetical protein
VTVTDRLEFAQAFNRLAVATRLPSAEADAAMQQVYWNGLSSVAIESVVASANTLARSAQWFPKVAEWREAAVTHSLHERLKLAEGREEPWRHECPVCEDTGWELRRCYPGTGKNCGRRGCVRGGESRYEHGYTERCTCRPNNRTYQRNQAVINGGGRS